MSKLFVVALFAVLAVALSQEDICGKCQTMCQNARTNYNNDFTNVQQADLQKFMEGQCTTQFSGFESSICKNVVDKNSGQMLKAFQAGENNKQICVEGKLC
ncbi:unnamed protein product, partial [Mesorhabditis spiculigera]